MTPVMIFAAGFGTRMAPLTDHIPKPLIEVAGKALLDHTLEWARITDTGPIYVNAHYKADQIEAHLSDANVTVLKEDPILDTGGGLKAALPHLQSERVFTMNSDAIWVGENPFKALSQAPKKGATLLLSHIDDVTGRAAPGDFQVHPDGRLTRGGDYVFLGAQILDPSPLLNIQKDVFSLNILWDRLIEQGDLYGCIYNGQWCDVGRPENIQTAETMLKYGNV